MQDGALASMRGEIENARKFLRVSEISRVVGSLGVARLEPTPLEALATDLRSARLSNATWRVLDHCAAVNRAYAVFERFIESVLSDWILERSKATKYAELPSSIRDAYAIGMADILRSLSNARYRHLSERDLVSGFSDALNGKVDYRLYPECLTYHRNNLRWSELNEVFSRCGIDKVDEWISHSGRLKNFFGTGDRISEQSKNRLAQLIAYRNDASHGTVDVDEILGREALEGYFDFVDALASDLMDIVRDRWVEWLLEIDEAKEIGAITEKFAGNIRIAICEGVALSVGQPVIVRKARYCRVDRIESIQIEDADVAQVAIGNPQEVGLKFTSPVPLQCKIVVPGSPWGFS